jgi:predicted aldo/keto reductase-like oxidoreductase
MVRSGEDFDRYLNEQLARLRTDHIDCYLLHGVNAKTWENFVLAHRLLERAEAAKRDGRVRHIGFSFHDGYPAFEKVLGPTTGSSARFSTTTWMWTTRQVPAV